MGSVASTNILMALITLVCLGLLASPVADPRRLAVNDQVARLLSGQVAPADFDYGYLRWRADRWGTRALQQLASARGDARTADIALRARQSLAQTNRWGGPGSTQADAVLTREEARLRIRLLQGPGATTTLPDSLIDALRMQNGKSDTSCLHPQHVCAVWMQDFNEDGQPEALVMVGYSTESDAPADARLFAQYGKDWRAVGDIHGMGSRKAWEEGIRSGKIRLLQPDWKDVELGGKRKSIIPARD